MKKLAAGFHFSNFTINNFINVLTGNGGIALFNSIMLATIAATLATVIGLWCVLITKHKSMLSRLIDFTSLPNTVPGIIVVIGLILFWNNRYNILPIYNTIAILVVGLHCFIFHMPYRILKMWKNVKP